MNDHAEGMGEDAFSTEDQAAWDAMREGGDAAPEPVGAVEPAAAAPVAPAAAEPAAAAPGEVIDPENEEGAPEENKGKFVRHGAFHQERERRKAVERQFAELQERHARVDERVRILSEAMNRPAPAAAAQPAAAAEPEKVPDPAEDIFGYVKHLEKQLEAVRTGQSQMTEAQKQAETARQAEAERNTVIGHYQTDIRTAVAADPTFADAYEHLFSGRVNELQFAAGLTQQQAVETAREEEFQLVQAAIARRVSPAALILKMAKGRGFSPKAPEPTPMPAAAAETPAERAARISKGQEASLSLSAAGGSPAGEITLEMLASMSEADFAKLEKSNPGRVRALMGG
ncbi:hypothetical protein FV232_00885 [Methylobacterium sp. WL30]|uniref:hypothetical protein n=2 Tax=Methylobacterium TaxID=407 RepID=UPI0011C96579|nr:MULTISPECIES: hypothetical protein [unclassified Methylobacterium]TXN52277.1 hypothetical protein FV227_04285 [Methylobacterium sp. WL119]TXN70640.1 hypothetical protein FV232_00885 [Methylobacterium sp. WL30]